MTAENRARLVLSSTAVLAVTGGLLGSQFWDVELLRLLLVIGVSALLGVALALGWFTAPPERTPAPPPDTCWTAPPPRPVPPPRPTPAPTDTTNERQWWNETGKPAPPLPVVRPEAEPLPGFNAHQAQIAQCPNCASFELDVRRDERAYAFQCRNPSCRTTWEWAPGSAWPPIVVRRNLTGGVPKRAGHTRADI